MTVEAVPVADQRAVIGAPIVLRWQATDADGEPAAPQGTVSVTVTRGDGTTVVASTAAAGAGIEPRTVTVPAASNDRLDLLTATWTDSAGPTRTTTCEVAGGVYFTLARARKDRALADTAKVTDADLIAARADVEHQCEQITGQAWVPRYRRITIDGSGGAVLVLPVLPLRRIRSATIDGVAVDPDVLALVPPSLAGLAIMPGGRTWTRGHRNVVLEVEHGHDNPPPDLVTATVLHARTQLFAPVTNMQPRVTQVSENGTTQVFAQPGRTWSPTGILDVDAVYLRNALPVLGIA